MTTRIFLKPYSVNGTGIRLLDYLRVSADTYEVTRWLTVLFIPLLPIGALLIRPGTQEMVGTTMHSSFQILGKRPMPWKRVFRMYGFTIMAAIPTTLCGIFETPGENTNMWLVLFVFSLLWAVACLIYAQRSGRGVYHAPTAQPLPTGGANPRRAA
jgi:hypothetical protein